MAQAGVAPGPPGIDRGMNDAALVIGMFASEEECVKALESLRDAGYSQPRVFSPVPSEKILEALELRKSPVRIWVLLGGITGVLTGFAITIGTSLTFPHYVGGKPLVSIPPFVIIAFELMILFGALSGLAGFLIHGGFPRFASVRGYSSRFADDRFGIAVRCPPGDRTRVEGLLLEAGAEDIQREPA